MIDMSSIQAKDKDRKAYDRLIAEFLARGGEIQVLPHIERQPIKQAVWNGGLTTHSENRKEFLRVEREIAEHGRALALIGCTVEEALRQLKKKWKAHLNLTAPKLEQLGARFGYVYASTERGRP